MTVISWKARQPERAQRALERQTNAVAKEPEQKKKLAKVAKKDRPKAVMGRARKDELMIKARELAASGACTSWGHLLDVMASQGEDVGVLRLWAGARDKDEIDLICARNKTTQRRR